MTPETFTDLLAAYGRYCRPELSFDAGQAFDEWQAQFLAILGDLRAKLPDRCPLEVVTEAESDEADHVRHRLRISVNDVWSLPAYLLVPKGLSPGEQRPALLVVHGHDSHGMNALCGVRTEGGEAGDPRRAYALNLVREGYVTLTPAWWGWPGRDGHVDRVGKRDKCNVIQMAAGMYGLNVLDMHIEDGQAAVDALSSRPEVDTNRIGCVGNSYGGRAAMWLTLFEDRIRACVAAGSMNTFRERSLKLSSCAIQYLPGILRYGDVQDLFSLIAPRPLQLQAGEGDGLITPGDRDMILETVRAAYSAAAAADHIEYVQHPDGHLLRCDLAAPFLRKHLWEGEA